MAYDGEAIYDFFFLIAENYEVVQPGPGIIPASKTNDCCSDFALKVFAGSDPDDIFTNDKSGFLFPFSQIFIGATITLQKWSNEFGGFFDTVDTLDGSAYGTFYDFGFHTVGTDNYIGYQLEWKKVYDAFGVGTYKLHCEGVLSIDGANMALESLEYCLEAYNADKADQTVRIEYYLNKQIGDSANDLTKRDFGLLNWYNSYRLPGFFGFPGSTYEKEYIQYQNGQRLWVKDEQEPEYTLKLKPVSGQIHDIMRTDVLQADEILITDYNSKNPHRFVQKSVYNTSDYRPDWKILQSKLAPVEVKFRQTYNNLKKRRC